jgi:hypothetical protein
MFPSAASQELYDQLVAERSVSRAAALGVGVQIETLDIADLQAAIRETDEPMLDLVYGNLLAGSNRHLSAFMRVLAGGETASGQALQTRRGRWA